MAFLDAGALYRGFVGGRGAGKSFVGAYDLILRAKPDRLYLASAPTYPMLEDATFRSFKEVATKVGSWAKVNLGDFRATLVNGAEVIFRSAKDPETLRGPNLSGVWLDEASLMRRSAFDICIASLREKGEQGWLGATFTPKGKKHWTYEVFGKGSPDTSLAHARTRDNPFLPPQFETAVRTQYTSALATQELEGEFVESEGYLFSRVWFSRILDQAPQGAGLQRVRFWDLAATDVKPGRDPDYTVGCLLGRERPTGLWYVLDIRRARTTPLGVEQLVRQTAEADGRDVGIVLEQEGGASGASLVSWYQRQVLAGWNVHGERPSGNKVARAQALAASAEAGNVVLVRGNWNRDFLDEVEMFPYGDHDDQVDAAAGAFNRLTQGTGLPCVIGLPPERGERRGIIDRAPPGVFRS